MKNLYKTNLVILEVSLNIKYPVHLRSVHPMANTGRSNQLKHK